MAQQNINIGTPNGNNGDFVRDAFSKTQDNFTELYNRPIANGLEAIDEGNGIGWRLIGKDPANVGNLGENAVDFTVNNNPNSTDGATGVYSFAAGLATRATSQASVAFGISTTSSGNASFTAGVTNTASGNYSTAFGNGSTASGNSSFAHNGQATGIRSFTSNGVASGDYSEALGSGSKALSAKEIALGFNNTTYSPSSTSTFELSDRILSVGIGGTPGSSSIGTEKDALIILKDGTITAPSLTNALIDASVTGKEIITKDWFNANINVGDITKVGTPVNNQVGVWTGDGTIEGTSNFTFNETFGQLAISSLGGGIPTFTISNPGNTESIVQGVSSQIYTNSGFTFTLSVPNLTGNYILNYPVLSANRTIATTNDIPALIDDDTLATATSTNIASAESIKAYVDANIGNSLKYSETFGDGVLTTIPITHNLGTQDYTYRIKEVSTGETIDAQVVDVDNNNVNLIFAIAPTTNQFRITFIA